MNSTWLKLVFLHANMQNMSGLIGQVFGVVAFAATLFLGGCNFGADNVGDIYSSGEPARNSYEHSVPESQKRGTVTGEPAPETSRY
jgi:hypothetical protein